MDNNMSVLIVDDSDIIRGKLHEMMEEVEAVKQVFLAQDFDSAMTEVRNNKPSVVLLDVNLPGKSGIEILKEIKTYNKAIRVIMVSNVSTEYHRKICGFLGADFFIDKHHDFENIPSLLDKLYTRNNN
jgi:DNA-binding NarL/FixJ family response regulator